MESWVSRSMEYIGFFIALFGVNKFMNSSISRRVTVIEDEQKENPPQTVRGCADSIDKCPVKMDADIIKVEMAAIKEIVTSHKQDATRETQNIHKAIGALNQNIIDAMKR